jgi:hypothetical protein
VTLADFTRTEVRGKFLRPEKNHLAAMRACFLKNQLMPTLLSGVLNTDSDCNV